MKNLIRSTSGRILALGFSIAIIGTGIAKLLGSPGLIVGCVAVLIAAAITVVGLAYALTDHFSAAVLVMILLPWLTFLGQVGQGLLSHSAGYPLVVAGLACLAFAARPRALAARRAAELTLARNR